MCNRLLRHVKGAWKAPRLRTRHGVLFECDLNDKVTREIYYTGFDNWSCRILKRLVKPGDVIVDAGANVGYFSLLCAKWLRGRGVVHSFEPFPGTAERFKRNLELNPRLCPMIHMYHLGLSDFTGTMGMTVPDTANQGCNFLSAGGATNVEVTTLDMFCEQERLTRLDLIKVDVEGSEVAFLKGAEKSIRRYRPVLMVEVNPVALNHFGRTAAELVETICQLRYRVHCEGRFGLRLLKRLPVYGEEPNAFAFPID